jgi:Domain of unknown function (DUF4411)
MAYLLDTNVFLQAKNLHYGFDFCPAFWDWLARSNDAQVVYSIEKVKDELEDDDAASWANGQAETFFLQPDAQVAQALATVSQWVMKQGYELAAVNTFLQVADYYLVAYALAYDFVLVTHEVPANSVKKIKIPNVCIGLGIKCVTPFEMLRMERARFVLA